ncbi:HD domain-containing protein [Rhizobium mongolense]|nr:HD family hydrolase [Rhizobium mongolense]
MLSGRRLDLLDPSPLDVELTDIAHGLARVARWNGQTCGNHAFSVAQHCLVVEDIFRRFNDATPDDCMMALLHDAPEYVIGDMISPFKSVVGGGYKAVEKRLEAAVHLRFGLPPHPSRELKDKIKKADTIAAYFEATCLAGFTPVEARKFFGQPRGISKDMLLIEPLPALEAQRLFCERFEAIETMRRSAKP